MSPTITVLLVEDEPGIRDLLSDVLEDGGFEVLVADSGKQALSVLEAQIGSLRGLITDVDLGSGPSGWEVARHARELNHVMPVVYISGGSAHDWSSYGVPNSTMVAKPFALAQIVIAISALLNETDGHH